MNIATLIGNVGKDPECGVFSNGNKHASFSLATSERWTDKASGEKKEKTQWHQIKVFGPLADVVQKYVKKGSKLGIAGKIENREYEKDGSKRYITEIVLQGFGAHLELLDRKEGGGGARAEPEGPGMTSRSPAAKAAASGGFDKTVDDEIPF